MNFFFKKGWFALGFVLRLTEVYVVYTVLSCMIKKFLWIVTSTLKVVADDVLRIPHWQVPVAHCFGPPGHYKRKFCTVCRKSLESPAFRCEGNLKNPTCIDIRVLSNNVHLVYMAYLWGYAFIHTHTRALTVFERFLGCLSSTHWLWKCVLQIKE